MLAIIMEAYLGCMDSKHAIKVRGNIQLCPTEYAQDESVCLG